MQKLLTFFQQKFSIYLVFNDQRFNDTLTNNIVSFEQLGPEYHKDGRKYNRHIIEYCIFVVQEPEMHVIKA